MSRPVGSADFPVRFGLALIAFGAVMVVATSLWGPSGDDGTVLYEMGAILVAYGVPIAVLSARSASIRTMGTPPPGVPAHTSPAKVTRMIELAEMQLLALTMGRSDINARAMGLIAFDGALGAVFIAGKDEIGTHIRLALLGLLGSVVLSLFATRESPPTGPQPAPYLHALDSASDDELDRELCGKLSLNVARTTYVAKGSHRVLQSALVLTLLTLGYVAYLALLSKGNGGHYALGFKL